ncbi:MAG: anti-anti-sigma factor [Paucimonas sp.]|nr:anti-anti-sigma factor [Paucimonas sp.]
MFQPGPSLTFAHARSVTEAGLRAIGAGESEVDFSGVTEVDSTAVAMLLAWQRAARAKGVNLRCTGLPSSLASLARLYGVEELLPA